MNGLVLVDAAALLFFLIGFHVAFRRDTARRWLAAIQARTPVAGASDARNRPRQHGDDEAASVFLMVGVMIMAFSFTAAAFANLLAYYTANSPN
jgi:hypothetical protein